MVLSAAALCRLDSIPLDLLLIIGSAQKAEEPQEALLVVGMEGNCIG